MQGCKIQYRIKILIPLNALCASITTPNASGNQRGKYNL